MQALPEHPTEHDRERFRAYVREKFDISWADDDFERYVHDHKYRGHIAAMLWHVWWSVERERQMLSNLNQSQAVEIQRLINKIAHLERL